MKKNSNLKLSFVIVLLGALLSNTVLIWSGNFFADTDQIELSKLMDNDGEENEEKSEKKSQEKIKYDHITTFDNIELYLPKSLFAYNIYANFYQEIVTPPPEHA